MNEFVFDERLFHILPLSIYFANTFFFYITWLFFVTPHVSAMTTLVFLALSVVLWYNFMKSWKGDPGLVKSSEDQRYRAIVELAEKSTEKNPFDPRVFCSTCLVRRPLR
jgi:membrane protein implicated in regulation of membrane protease activity